MNEKRNNQQQNKMTIEQINAQYGKIPPQAIEIEEAVLGALMLERDAIHQVSDVIDTLSFYKQEHQKIFEVIKYLAQNQKPVDLLMVTQELKNRDLLEVVGGPMMITQLTSRVASAAHIEFHSRIIAQKFMQREMIRVSTEIQTKAYDDTMDVDDLLGDARTAINEIDNLMLCSNSGQTSHVVASEELKEIEKDCQRAAAGLSPGIPTGLNHLDRVTGGWRKTDLIILAARPSVGKSSLSFHFDKVAAKNDFWVNHYSFEMKNGKIFRINLSSETGIPRSNIRDGVLTDADWHKINLATGKLENLKIIWNDNSKITVNHIRANTIRNVRAGRCDLVVIDYLQLIKPTDKKAIREQQIADISRTLKEIAMECNVPVIALSQLNREVEKRSDKEPTLADLRESGSLEQDADVIIFVWDKDEPKMSIGKNRNGKIGHVDFWANSEKTRFADREPTEFDVVPSAAIPVNEDFDNQTGNDLPF
jgi:replicative DNA helicase